MHVIYLTSLSCAQLTHQYNVQPVVHLHHQARFLCIGHLIHSCILLRGKGKNHTPHTSLIPEGPWDEANNMQALENIHPLGIQ